MMVAKLFHVLFFASMPLTTMAGSDTLDVDVLFLNYLVTEAKNAQSNNGTCKYLSENETLFTEFVTYDKTLIGAKYTNTKKDKVAVFIPVSKSYRPGLWMTINLSGGQCVGFELGEVMN